MSRNIPDYVLEWMPSAFVLYEAQSGHKVAEGMGGELPKELSKKNVIVLLSRRASFVRTARLPMVTKEETLLLAMGQADELFPLPLDEVAFDVLLTKSSNELGRLCTFGFARQSDLDTLYSALRHIGAYPLAVSPVGFVAAQLASKEQDAVLGSKEIGGIGIDLLSNGDLVGSRSAVPGSGLSEEVARTFQAHGVQTGVVLAEPGLTLPGSMNIGQTLVSKAVSAYEGGKLLNLELPEEVAARTREQAQSKKRFALITLLAGVAAVGAVMLGRQDDAAKITKQQAQYKELLRHESSISKGAESDYQDVAVKQEVLARAFEPGQKLGDALLVVTNDVPDGVWLSGLSADRGKPMQLRGFSKTNEALAEFLRRLGSEPRIRDAHLVFSTNSTLEKTPVVSFAVEGTLVGNLGLIDNRKESQ